MEIYKHRKLNRKLDRGNVAVHMRKVDNPECKVISLIVDADKEMCIKVASLDIRVHITHLSR